MYRDFYKYEIFADGRIWSKKQKKFLKPYTMKNGYQMVSLMDNEGKLHKQYVHRVTWIAVNGREIPKGYELHHLDENKMNNQISNLLLCSHRDNINHGTHNERSAASRINHPERSKRVGAFKDGEIVMCFASINEAGRNGYDSGHVSKCCNGKLKTHKGFEWKYLEE